MFKKKPKDKPTSLEEIFEGKNASIDDVSELLDQNQQESTLNQSIQLNQEQSSQLISQSQNNEYEKILDSYNSAINKKYLVEQIAKEKNTEPQKIYKELSNLRKQSNKKIKYSTLLKEEVTEKEAATLLFYYLKKSNKPVKTIYKAITKIDVSTNFYRALDDFSEKLGIEKIRKKNLSNEDKYALTEKIRTYM